MSENCVLWRLSWVNSFIKTLLLVAKQEYVIYVSQLTWYFSRNVKKRACKHKRPAKFQINMRIRTVSSESSLAAFWIAIDSKFLHVYNNVFDQIVRICWLIWVFVGRTHQGPVAQSVVSLTSLLRVISLTVLADSIYNFLKFFAEKMWVVFAQQKLLTFFQQKISAYLRITQCKF